MEESQPLPQILSPCSSGRSRSSTDDANNSPEFEFWMIKNNPSSFPQPNLLSADELFSDGFLLPLHLLQPDPPPMPPPFPSPPYPEPSAAAVDQPPQPEPSTVELADDLSPTCSLTSSKRWRYIFKKNDDMKEKDVSAVKEKKRDQKKNGGGGGGVGGASNVVVSAAELNINIWPFSRSRSAGNGGARPRSSAAAARKVSSAPCSRSNSTGESKYRKWPPNSPSRAGGVHLGRSSPVWKVRRGGGAAGGGRSLETLVKNAEKGAKNDGNEGRKKIPASSSGGGGGARARVLSLNVPMCIGYRHHLSCRSDENSAVSVAAAAAGGSGAGGRGESQIGGGVAGEGVRRSNLFNIRSMFTKKVY